jgi:hypothetical protein
LNIGLALIFQEVYTRARKAKVVMMIYDVVYSVYQGVSGCGIRAFGLSMLQNKDEV